MCQHGSVRSLLGLALALSACDPGVPVTSDAGRVSDRDASVPASLDAAPVPDAFVAPSDPLEALVPALAGAACDAHLACSGPWVGIPWAPDCDLAETAWFEGWVARVEHAAAAGRARIDVTRRDACLAALTARPCHALETVSLGCAGLVVGLVAEGGACLTSLDCGLEAECAPSGECFGTCRSRLAEGVACGALTASCGTGLTCNGTCVPPNGPGASCAGAPCDDGLSCAADDDGVFTCRDTAALYVGDEGQSCGFGVARLCRPDLTCLGDPDGSNPTCRPPIARGEPCAFGARCAGPTDVCDASRGGTGRCVPIAGEGEPCTAGVFCAFGSFCSEGVCERAVPATPCG